MPATVAASRFQRVLRAIEPWYDWGDTYIERLDETGSGPGRFFTFEWLGISFTLFYGRTPKVRS